MNIIKKPRISSMRTFTVSAIIAVAIKAEYFTYPITQDGSSKDLHYRY